jgi:hypothetical protein
MFKKMGLLVLFFLAGCNGTVAVTPPSDTSNSTNTGSGGTANSSPTPTPSSTSQAIDPPAGHYLLVASEGNEAGVDGVITFQINTNGTLSFLSTSGLFNVGDSQNVGVLSFWVPNNNPTEIFVFPGTTSYGPMDAFIVKIQLPSGTLIDTGNPGVGGAEMDGANLNNVVKSVVIGNVTYKIESNSVVEIANGMIQNSYTAGSKPVSLLLQ